MHKIISVLSIGCVLSGCAPVVFMGATTSVATSAAEERGLGGVISDAEIKSRVMSLYSQTDMPLNSHIEVVVRQGVVLLSGVVESQKEQIEAVRLAWMAKGVQEVHDEITVGSSAGLGSMAKDSWISTQLKTKILFDDKVSSINYNLHTIEGVIYLMGIAKSQQELDHVIDQARHISGVKKVVSYVRISNAYIKPESAPQPSYEASTTYGEPAVEPDYSPKETQPSPSSQYKETNTYQGSAFD